MAQSLDEWIKSAAMEDIILWKPPNSTGDSPITETAAQQVGFWTWIVERYTQTYLDQWSLESLKLEYLFLQGKFSPDLPAEFLSERVLARADVTSALADMTILSDSVTEPSTMASFTEQALALLADGQRNAAAALFDAVRTLKPGDQSAHNNYAFCILIDDPRRARAIFKEVLANGMRSPAVCWCNLALAESLLGNADEALQACDEAYAMTNEKNRGYLWSREGDDWSVTLTNLLPWIARLGVELEQSLGRSDDLWAGRLARLTLFESQAISSDLSSGEKDEADL
jgi:hypothetical protein